MTGSLWELALAASAFVGAHVVLSSTPLRASLVSALGEKGFLGIFSLQALALLVWMAIAYNAAPFVQIWPSTTFFRHLTGSGMLIAAILLVGGLSVQSPTAAGVDVQAAMEKPLPGFLRITRHPVMWAIALWGILHVLANGDAASVLFFGSLALLALWGTVLIDSKRRRTMGEGWAKLAGETSNVPFVAVLSGRARLAFGDIGWRRLAAGVALYAVLLFGHEPVFGVWPLAVGAG